MTEQLRASHAGGGPSWPRELGVFGLLMLVALLLRFPFFFPAVIDWDESTFVLMGQSILDGHLPYLELWDNKPPLAFAFYALAIAVFGKDLVGVRLAGTLCVALTAFLVYLTANCLWNRRAGLTAATLCIVVIGLLRSGQATMTEHVALLPLVGALYLLIRTEASVGTLLLVGVLLAAATLVRSNIAYVVIVVGLYIAASAIRSPMKQSVKRIVAYAVGGIVVVGVTWLPYALAGQQETWWASTIVAPLSYSSSQHSVFGSLVGMARLAFNVRWSETGYRFPSLVLLGAVNAFLWFGAVGGLATILWRWKRLGNVERRGMALLLLFTLGTCAGILMGGATFQHYLIQLVPFAALLSAVLIQQLPLQQFPRSLRWSSALVAGIFIVSSMAPIFAEYKVIVSRALRHGNLRHGAAYEIAAYLKRENTSGAPVCLLTDHIAYWFLGLYPLTKMTTHPSNIFISYLLQAVVGKDASTEAELRKVFRKNPEFVVTKGDIVWYLSGNAEALLERILADEYVLTTQIEGREIYRKKPKVSNISSARPLQDH